MTVEDIYKVYKAMDERRKTSPLEREGQLFFNCLLESYPQEAEQIRGTKYDPFYNNNLKDCINYLLSINNH